MCIGVSSRVKYLSFFPILFHFFSLILVFDMPSDKLKKRKKGHRFLPGNKFSPKKDPPTGDEQHQQPKFFHPADDGVATNLESSSGPQLRSSAGDIENEMRLLHLTKNNIMWNTAFKEHSLTKCKKAEFTQGREVRRGVVVQQTLKCKFCDYESEVFKLYDEVDIQGRRGPKAAAPNVSLQIALQDTSIANTKARTLLSALDLCVPDKKSMDKTAARVSEEISKVAEAGCNDKLKDVSKGAGLVKLGADTRYDTCRPASSRRTGLPLTSQAITLAIEHNSAKKYIVGVHIQNKLCKKCSPLGNTPCDQKDCTANVHPFDSLSEKKAGEEIGRRLAEEGVSVSYCTTDGDGRFVAGLQSVEEHKDVVRLADTVHLGQTQIKRGRKVEWSHEMFPGTTTKVVRDKCKNALAVDLKNRSFAVLHQVHKKHKQAKNGKISQIKDKCQNAVEDVLMFYKGNCEQCSMSKTACEGGASSNNWITNSKHLQEHKLGPFNLSVSDEAHIRDILNMVIGPDGVDKTRFITNTQLNEAVNRSLSSCLPKNVKQYRTLRGRVARVCEKHNYGPGLATARIHRHLRVPVSNGQRRFLRIQQKYWRKAQGKDTRTRARKLRLQRDSAKRQLRKLWAAAVESDYLKDQLDHNYQVKSLYLACPELIHLCTVTNTLPTRSPEFQQTVWMKLSVLS